MIIDVDFDDEEALAHFGVKGMHWGVRHDGPDGVSRATNHMAKKDAAEFAKAKAFYGKGAGTRRKLIAQTVTSRSKDASYRKAFDHHLANQDGAKRAAGAHKERNQKDRREKNRQRAGFLARRATGQDGTQAAFTAAALAGAAFLASPKGRQMASNAVNNAQHHINAAKINKILNL